MDKRQTWDSLTIEERILFALNNSTQTSQEAQLVHTIESEEELRKLINNKEEIKTEEI
jgi:nitrogen regulatory protein PII-like uncharacterized protein